MRTSTVAGVLGVCAVLTVLAPSSAFACRWTIDGIGQKAVSTSAQMVLEPGNPLCAITLTIPFEGGTVTEVAAHGSASMEAKKVQYVPAKGYRGDDTFKISGVRAGNPFSINVHVTVQ